MARGRDWLLPALLGATQLAYWPGLRLGSADPVRATAGAALVLVVCAALVLRRHRPVVAVAVVGGGLVLGMWMMPGQVYFVPGDALLVVALAEWVALFSVAARCSRRTTLVTVAGLLVLQALLVLDDEPLDLLVSLAAYAVIVAAGRVRRRWLDDRAAAAHRLAEAEEARRDAAAAEQRRLARELHDVTAHHLTSIVVNASAAQFVGKPELQAEALEFAARTGRETLAALHELVAVLPTEPPAASLVDLVDDFRQLGQQVRLEVTGDPPPAAMLEALHGIAREALTNTLRYAPGATVRLHLAYGPEGSSLVVEDDGAASPQATGLGGGRGLIGMRDRAAALGGTVEAGTRAEGGWRVRATLPASAAPTRLRVWLRSQVVLDGGLTLLTLLLPLAGTSALIEENTVAPAAATLVLLAVLAHAVPLLWRRQRPWTALIAVALTVWLGPLLLVTDVLPGDEAWIFVFGWGADLAAVYALAAYGRRPNLTWIGVVAGLASCSFAFGTMLSTTSEPVALAVFGAVLGWFLLGLPFAGSWLGGWATRRRRRRRLDREEGAVAVVSAQAERRARDERVRVAAGLRQSVLSAAARVPQAAEAHDLDGVVDSAREALAAMRGMLDELVVERREVPSSPSV